MLRIIADDLGLHESVNDGIIELLKNKHIDGASLMANGRAFDDAIAEFAEVQPRHIGLHFVLVEEAPLTGIKLPKNYKSFFIKYILGLIKLSDVEKECKAQIDKCINKGIKPSFVNSHQHLHLLPGIIDIAVKLAKDYGIQHIRIVSEPGPLGQGKLLRKLQLFVLQFLSKRAKRKIKKAGLECNDFFVGFINAGNMRKSDMEKAMSLSNKYPDKVVELGCHPGYENEDLMHKYKHWGNYSWQKELETLKTSYAIKNRP